MSISTPNLRASEGQTQKFPQTARLLDLVQSWMSLGQEDVRVHTGTDGQLESEDDPSSGDRPFDRTPEGADEVSSAV